VAVDLNVRVIEAQPSAPARNVIAVLPGSDPALRGEYVALGAHSDHLGVASHGVDADSLRAWNTARWKMMDLGLGPAPTPEELSTIHVNVDSLHKIRPAHRDSTFNGADDDGSGTVSLLEIAQAFTHSAVKPKRSILFVWHTAEEKGLLGSAYYTDHPTISRDSIVGQLNLDMVGRGDPGDWKGGGPRYLMLVGSRRLSTELGDMVESINKTEPEPFIFDYTLDANGHPENVYCRSDHYEYARFGIPIVFFTTGLHQDYHQVTDEVQYIDFTHMARVDRLVFDIAMQVANLDHRLVVDKPKPDPHGVCKQ
jgi:Zn-dependent M28 family amino/carboxypeptidase